jgi:hypothetical protein
MARESLHVEPHGIVAITRHYMRDLVYGANDGIITTFAVVAGVAGGDLTAAAVLIIGAANLAADGVSMGAGNLLAIRAHESAREAEGLPEEEAYPHRHGWRRSRRSCWPAPCRCSRTSDWWRATGASAGRSC